MQNGNGWFLVRFPIRDGKPVAELTGDHFKSNEKDEADRAVIEYWIDSMSNGGSPAYLVSDSVVEVALGSSRRAERCGLSDCHKGVNGKSCGVCDICITAERDAFTRVILGAVVVKNECLKEAVESVIGMTFADAPWRGGMTSKEVSDVFDEANEIGLVSPGKEKDDETH